jgi:hypothetical protein
MHTFYKRLCLAVMLLAGSLTNRAIVHANTPFLVDSILDEVDAQPGDGQCISTPGGHCTLRAAVMEANALAGPDIIDLPAGIYAIAIPGTGEDETATGDLDLRSDLTLTGAAAATTIIDGNKLDRVLDAAFYSSVMIIGVTIQNGQTPSVPLTGINNSAGIRGSSYTLQDSVITGNHSPLAGGGLVAGANTNIINSSIFSNTAVYGAAGIYSVGAVTITNSSIYSNTTPDHGGGLWMYDYVTIVNSTIRGNSANQGSGINNYGRRLTLINSTVSDNSGTGIFTGGAAGFPSEAVLINSTVSQNTFGGVAGFYSVNTLLNTTVTGNNFGISGSESTFTIGNSLMSNNTQSDCNGTVNSLGYNLIENAECTISGTTTGNQFDVDPGLGLLQNNGGPTFTHLPDPGSPAINTGNPSGCTDSAGQLLATDQRGVARPQGSACDIGAVERILTCGFDQPGNGQVFKLYLPFISNHSSSFCP